MLDFDLIGVRVAEKTKIYIEVRVFRGFFVEGHTVVEKSPVLAVYIAFFRIRMTPSCEPGHSSSVTLSPMQRTGLDELQLGPSCGKHRVYCGPSCVPWVNSLIL